MNEEILQRLELFSLNDDKGIGAWFKKADPVVLLRLKQIDDAPLSKVQLNQLLLLSHEGSVSDGFFEYYWLKAPASHRTMFDPWTVLCQLGSTASRQQSVRSNTFVGGYTAFTSMDSYSAEMSALHFVACEL